MGPRVKTPDVQQWAVASIVGKQRRRPHAACRPGTLLRCRVSDPKLGTRGARRWRARSWPAMASIDRGARVTT
jgi:hypothetical protein